MSEKIYIGRGKKVGQYGTIAVSICIDDIPKEHITKAQPAPQPKYQPPAGAGFPESDDLPFTP